MPDPFISTTDLVEYLGKGSAADPGMLIAVEGACDMVRTITELSFSAGTATQKIDGTGTDALLLRERPIGTVTVVSVAGSAVTDYIYTDDGLLFRQDDYGSLTWPEGRRNVEVTYEYGYDDDDLPRDIRMVALALATRIVVQGAVLEEQQGESRIKYGVNSTDLTNGEKMILDKYKRLA